MKVQDAQAQPAAQTVAAAAESRVEPYSSGQTLGFAPSRGATLQARIDRSPRMQAQARSMDALFGGKIQRPGGVPQRKTALALVTDVATSDISQGLLRQLVVEHGLTKYAQVIEKGALGLIDYFVASDLAASFVPSLKNLLGYLTPYVGTVQTLRSVFRAFPEPLQKVIVYFIGQGLMSASKSFLGGFVTEAWVNKLLVGPDWGESLDQMISWTTWMHEQLDSISRWPLTRLYEMSWAAASRIVGSGAASWASHAVERSFGVEGSRQEGPASDDGGKSERSETADSLVRADLKYIWLEIDQPRLDRWTEGSPVPQDGEERSPEGGDQVERGGLVLPFKFGLALFGARLDTKAEQLLRLPWSGGFRMHLRALDIKPPGSLAPVFSVETLTLDEVLFTHEGLQAFEVSLHTVAFADGAVKMPLVGARWEKDEGLLFHGLMTTRILDTPIRGEADLGLNSNGDFDHGKLTVEAVDDIPIIPGGALALSKPGFKGGVDKNGTIDISVFSGVKAEFAIFALQADRAHIDYHKGEGHEFRGGVDALRLRIGEHVTLEVVKAELQRGLLHIAEASLVYEHNPKLPQRDSAALDAIAFPTSILEFVGLESLRIRGTVKDIRIGAGGVEAAATVPEVVEPPVEGVARAATGEESSGPPVSVGSKELWLSKLGMRVLGVAAEVDLEQGRGTVAGELKVAPTIPSLDFEFPIFPQLALMGHASLKAQAQFGAALAGTLQKGSGTPEIPFHLGSKATLSGDLAVIAKVGVHFGSHFLASIGASLFAEAKASLGAQADLSGVLYVNPETRSLRYGSDPEDALKAHYLLSAALEASLGMMAEVRAFYFFEGELFRYTFKTWKLGSYRLEGDIKAKADGGHEVEHQEGKFDGVEGKPHAPELEVTAVVDARAFLLERGREIPGSGEKRQQIIEELIGLYKNADAPVAEAVQAAAERAAELSGELVTRKLELAMKGGALTAQELAECEQGSSTVAHAYAALERLRQDYREVQLVLVDWNSALEQVPRLEKGEFDIAALEQRIREVGEARERRKAELKAAEEKLGGAELILTPVEQGKHGEPAESPGKLAT